MNLSGYEDVYYKIGEDSKWEEVQDIIEKKDFIDLKLNNLVNEDNTINVYAKLENTNNSNQVIIEKKFKVIQPSGGILNEIQTAELVNENYYETTIEGEKYSMHTYVYDGDQEWDSDMIFGDENDVAKSTSEYAKNMVVVKVNGNLTIGEGATITSYASSYGGPKGMLLYVTGDLINNGNISMTGRGAYAEGQNVFLWSNGDWNMQYIPKTGGTGGAAVYSPGTTAARYGISGQKGTNRATGGGASGAAVNYSWSGQGTAGTSYSGGTGGGGAWNRLTAGSGGVNGGIGGNASGKKYEFWTWSCGGGAGNPGGSGINGGGSGGTGTGGLLIIYSSNITNNGTISSNGSKGR